MRYISPALGAGAIGACPLCWIGSASLLSYLGLGVLIPFWRWVAFGFLVLAAIGFAFDFRAHRNYRPLALLIFGAILLYVGRYVTGGPGFGGWPVWGLGVIAVISAVFYNKWLFRKTKTQDKKLSKPLLKHLHKNTMDIKDFPYACPDCGFHFRDEATAKDCEKWCTEKGVCNSEIRKQAFEMQKND